jgi:putative ABC transport system permease protein
MKPRDLTDLALRNLREAIFRNALTTLGIAVGVASLVAILSIGVGLQELFAKKLSQSGLFDTVIVTPKNNFRGAGGGPRREATTDSDKPPRPLDEEARKEIEKLPNVVEVYPQIRFFTEVRFNNKPFATVVAGMPDSSRNSGSFDGMQGTFFSSKAAEEAILQIEFAKDLSSDPSSLIGKELILRYAERQALPVATPVIPGSTATPPDSGGFSVVPRELHLKIIGVVETEPAAGFGGFGNARLLIPLETASTLRAAQVNDLRDIVRGSNSGKIIYASLSARAKSPSQVDTLESSIKSMGFGAFSLLDASKSLKIFFTVFDSLLAIFGSLALSIATLGIVNTLITSVMERRREIGVLKALGASDPDIQKLFFVEAGVLGMLGGFLGVFFGWLLGRAITLGTNIYLKRQNLNPIELTSVPWWLFLSAILFAILVSLAAGLYPASRAAKLNPVDALRYE